VLLEAYGKLWGQPVDWYTARQAKLPYNPTAVSGVPARDASASPPALGVFRPNGDVRVKEDMTSVVHTYRNMDHLFMREAPIVRREHAIAVRYYADLSLLPGLTAFAPECKDVCIFVDFRHYCLQCLLSHSPDMVMVAGSRMSKCNVPCAISLAAHHARYSRWTGINNHYPACPTYTACTSNAKQSWPNSPDFFRVLDQTIVSPEIVFGTAPPHMSVSSLRDPSTSPSPAVTPPVPVHFPLPPARAARRLLAHTARPPRRRLGIDGNAGLYRDGGRFVCRGVKYG
jgi:hypothetical protein